MDTSNVLSQATAVKGFSDRERKNDSGGDISGGHDAYERAGQARDRRRSSAATSHHRAGCSTDAEPASRANLNQTRAVRAGARWPGRRNCGQLRLARALGLTRPTPRCEKPSASFDYPRGVSRRRVSRSRFGGGFLTPTTLCARRTMLRKLLACLALLTGLAAAGAPVQAEVTSAVAAQLEASAASPAAARGAVVAVRSVLPRKAERALTPAPVAPSQRPAPVATVRLGSDRARE